MAAAEARAAWQRANRYFVQEDAKRAPKLASHQPSNSSWKQVDAVPTNPDRLEHPAIRFMPFNGSPYSNLPPNSKWWLQMQHNYMNQRDVNAGQFNGTKHEADPFSPHAMENQCEDSLHRLKNELIGSFLDVKKCDELRSEELNVTDSKVEQDILDVMNMTDYYELLEMEMIGSPVSKQSGDFSSSVNSSFVGRDKVPWWRVTDEQELASFVAHKSLLHIENCDLPPPQKVKVKREPCKEAKSMDNDEIFMGSLECEAQSEAYSSPSSGGSQRRHWSSVKGALSNNENLATESLRSSNHETLEKARIYVDDPGNGKLLEALCHSQTRAREAENAAKQAYSEKEHILKLFLRQASQLFAYKQWFKMLQLENLLLQNGNQNSVPSSPFPDQRPWTTEKPQKLRKTWKKSSKAKRRRRESRECDIGRYAVAFAVGFTLVGAGLIIGWTVGWLFPAF